jgi:glycosyltransferase involved in cell wall biosynthesis
MERHLGEENGATLELVLPRHWGGGTGWSHGSEVDLSRLAGHPSVTTHGPMGFGAFREFLSGVDVAIDLFEHNLEREYAMVTRSVVALACGVPVIHPPFTEVSPMISSYDAGWLVDPEDEAAFDAVVRGIVSDPAGVYRKKKNARALARDLLDPAVAVEPLARILERA